MWFFNHTPDLYHYGVKGMKWGVRRTPEQLGRHKKRLTNPIIGDMIKSGKVSIKVNAGSQSRHILGSRGYVKGKSILFGTFNDAQRLIDELSGTGEALIVKGEWKHKERVSADRVIGIHINPKNGKMTRTNKAMIIYAKTGTHIYPREREKGE